MKTAQLSVSILVILAFLGLNDAMGQWGTIGTNIYNTNSGNVGIGTNNPVVLLHVGKNIPEPQIMVNNIGNIGGATFRMVDNNSGADWKFKATNAGGFKIRDNVNGLDVMTFEYNSAAHCIYVNSAGNVGVGTNSPTYKLFLESGDYYMHDYYPFIYLDNTSSGGNAGLTFRQNGSYAAWLFYDNGEGLLRLNCEAGGGGRNDLVILSNGNVCLGTTNAAAGYRLSVNGKVACEEVLVELDANWPDYVFAEGYNLMSLQQLEKSIKTNNHLPGLPSATEVKENGFELADMQKRVLEKVEELTLYTIEQGKQIEQLNLKNMEQARQIEELQEKLAEIQNNR